ncbi:MAG: DUF4180 domain-containing protein [Sphaerochaeta sp.]
MKKNIVRKNGISIAIIQSDSLVITDAQSALDLLATLDYDHCHRIELYKETIIEDFFALSSGIAGDILQNFVNYSMSRTDFSQNIVKRKSNPTEYSLEHIVSFFDSVGKSLQEGDAEKPQDPNKYEIHDDCRGCRDTQAWPELHSPSQKGRK